jgi:hypothetical protein
VNNPLLTDLHFDVAEQVKILGVRLPDTWQPVLWDTQGQSWIAWRRQPPAVYVPGLPTESSDALGHFSANLFFNALRWLLTTRELPPLFTLTTPAQPEPNGSRLALHEGEGDTSHIPLSLGTLDTIMPVALGTSPQPIWHRFLAIAMGLFVVDRACATFGGARWR